MLAAAAAEVVVGLAVAAGRRFAKGRLNMLHTHGGALMDSHGLDPV